MGNVTGYDLRNFYNGITKKDNPLYRYQFLAEFVGLKDEWGISDSSDAAKNISYYFKSTTIPGFNLNNGQMTYLGTQFRLPGNVVFTHSWTASLLLEQNFTAYKGFRRWQEDISSLTRDGGGNKAIPNVKVRLSILNPDMETRSNAIILEGVWVKNVQQLPLRYNNGGGDNPDCQIEFRYQYNYLDNPGAFDMSTDPLKA